MRGAAEAQHVSGDGVQREASLPAGRDGYDGRALRGASRRVFGEWQARGSGSEVGGLRSGCPPAARSSPRKKGAQRRGGVAAPVSARAEREMGASGMGARVGWRAGRGAWSPEAGERKPGRPGRGETNAGGMSGGKGWLGRGEGSPEPQAGPAPRVAGPLV